MSTSQLCLLCLQIIDKAAKPTRKIRIKTVCKLMTPCHHNSNSTHDFPPEFEDDDICEVCDGCYPVFSTMEEIRSQISLLEEEIVSKVREIQATILHASSSHLQNNRNGKIIQIRNILLKLTGESGTERDTNFVPNEDDVKEEEDEIDPLADLGDQLLYDDINSFCEASIEKTEEEDFIEDEDEESAFCIIPWPQTSSTKREENPKCSSPTKRRIEGSPLPKTNSKKTKLQRGAEEASAPRISPTNKQTAPPIHFNSLVQVRVIKRSNLISKSESSVEDDDAKPGPGSNDKDLASKIEFVDTSDDIRPRFHKCTQCAKSFPTKQALNRHTPKCRITLCIFPLCTATFYSKGDRDAHMLTDHEGRAYQCRICKTKFRGLKGLAAHLVMRHEDGEKKLSCVKCEKKFCLEENLARHLKLHEVEEIKPLVCDLCDDRCENEELLKKHMAMTTHTKRFECTQCPQKCRNRVALERHLNTHTKEKPDKCPHCDHTAADKYNLQDHIARAHPSGPPTHICHICGKGFYVHADLKTHLSRHDGKFGRKCGTCGETFASWNDLQSHLVKVHGKDPFVCDECGASFTTRGGLNHHKKIHAGEKKHKCETCGACFFGLSYLNVHMRTHTGERPFPCPQCDKAFKSRTHLNNHVKVIHTPGYVAPTPHKCPHCDKGCTTPFFLRCHIRQAHTGERPFICDQCAKGFAVKSALTLHLKTAHGVVPEKKNRLPRSKKDVFHAEEDSD
ncbi:zinc finger protein 2 homolog isoform X2 [Folsomia candida]|uniref:zinc finger protein 2 homolog isoform X2 n=1 Tax=Folsomia candida TaxID=158441 RepID=UPI000B906E13|nr:zinc finger protein 2 homolog isoform X2 [Folsomia candida]